MHDQTLAYLATLDDALWATITAPWDATARRIDMFDHIIEHETHHRGELSLILGLFGRQGLDA